MGATTTPAVAVPLSPQRQALAVEIEALRAADVEIEALQENDAARTEYSYACLEAIDAAETALRDATRRLQQAFSLASRTQWEPDPTPPIALTEAIPAARRRYDEALAARDSVKAELLTAEDNRKRIAARVQKGALAVVAAHAVETGLIEEINRHQRAALDAGLKLAWLHHHGAIDTTRANPLEPSPVAYTMGRVRGTLGWAKELPDVAGAQPYALAVAALMTDPTAEIGG